MLRPTCKITIGTLEFDFLNELEIVSSWKNLTDTAVLRLPNKIKQGGKSIVSGADNLFKRGDEVKIVLGYYPETARVFTGFVAGITPDSPLVLQLEDHAYLFKQKSITASYKEVTLSNLLTDLCPIEFYSVDANLGAFRISNANFAQVLAELKKTYGLVSWVKEGILFCGLPYFPTTNPLDGLTHKLSFQRNIIESSLEYLREDDVKIKVKGVSILKDNSRIEIEAGDPEGAQRSLFYYGLNESDLKEIVDRELPKLKYEGYRGGLTTFGSPTIKHGDTIELTDLKFPERAGEYLVDEVVTTQGLNGFRQQIALGAKVSAS
jgi:hypothetical protein